ncbi:hypothetical protein IWW49_003094, partial [Coemansia sp. RSA 1797]
WSSSVSSRSGQAVVKQCLVQQRSSIISFGSDQAASRSAASKQHLVYQHPSSSGQV